MVALGCVGVGVGWSKYLASGLTQRNSDTRSIYRPHAQAIHHPGGVLIVTVIMQQNCRTTPTRPAEMVDGRRFRAMVRWFQNEKQEEIKLWSKSCKEEDGATGKAYWSKKEKREKKQNLA